MAKYRMIIEVEDKFHQPGVLLRRAVANVAMIEGVTVTLDKYEYLPSPDLIECTRHEDSEDD